MEKDGKQLTKRKGTVDRDAAWEALMTAVQEPNPADITSNTQWSILFDNTNGTAEITLRRQWEDRYTFEIGN